MQVLRDTLNYRNIILDDLTQNGRVKVRLRSGENQEMIWCGFLDITVGRRVGRRVKLKVRSYSHYPGKWIKLADDAHILGCLVVGKVCIAFWMRARFVYREANPNKQKEAGYC